MYIPEIAVKVDALPQIRLCIQGASGTGKTVSALTFPEPLVINLDRGLSARYAGIVHEIPLWDPEVCDKLMPRSPAKPRLPNKRDAALKFIQTDARKMTKEQTLVFDGGTGIQNAFHSQYERKTTKGGKFDDFDEWAKKIEYFGELFEELKTLKCHVVFICHEQAERKEGDLTGKVRPLFSGQIGDQLGSHFTDYFRMHAMTKHADINKYQLPLWGWTKEEMENFVKQFDGNTMYCWQTKPDDIANCKSSTAFSCPKFIKADFETLIKVSQRIS